jgi:hypothetical protein
MSALKLKSPASIREKWGIIDIILASCRSLASLIYFVEYTAIESTFNV